MDISVLTQRPASRITPVLEELKIIWHFYPEYSLAELLTEIVLYTNLIETALPTTSLSEIEDIPYPKGHYLHECRNLDMGIAELYKQHQHKPLPPTPFQTAVMKEVEANWRNNPDMRLGQLIMLPNALKDLIEGKSVTPD